jgi:hypothetical protein
VKTSPVRGEERDMEIKQMKLIARNSGYNTSSIMGSYNKWKNNEIMSSEVFEKWVIFS